MERIVQEGVVQMEEMKKLREGEEMARLLKAEIAVHPLCEQLVGAHVGCLRVVTPIDHLPFIDAQVSQSHHLVGSYAAQRRDVLDPHDKQELDSFLTQYLVTLCSFKEQLQHHVRVHAVEAVMACREIEQSLHDLTEAFKLKLLKEKGGPSLDPAGFKI